MLKILDLLNNGKVQNSADFSDGREISQRDTPRSVIRETEFLIKYQGANPFMPICFSAVSAYRRRWRTRESYQPKWN